ncbi:hypothetical protein EYF80_061490 [Liparis tanakae]|uniref:Uncharacterized protein n=1 Tax=Liparis tanakae TaxID=230148 RepID=A0A4Z2EHR7_9TELE|nr:hypothetical protein EYF80_061490 [Liparis tanakae]
MSGGVRLHTPGGSELSTRGATGETPRSALMPAARGARKHPRSEETPEDGSVANPDSESWLMNLLRSEPLIRAWPTWTCSPRAAASPSSGSAGGVVMVTDFSERLSLPRALWRSRLRSRLRSLRNTKGTNTTSWLTDRRARGNTDASEGIKLMFHVLGNGVCSATRASAARVLGAAAAARRPRRGSITTEKLNKPRCCEPIGREPDGLQRHGCQISSGYSTMERDYWADMSDTGRLKEAFRVFKDAS